MQKIYLMNDIPSICEMNQIHCSGSGMVNLFNLPQRMKGNIGRHLSLYKLFL